MYSVDEALEQLLARPTPRPAVESVPLEEADGRITADPVVARVSAPPADNSAMDGYAVRCADIERLPCTLPVSARIAAGEAPAPLAKGTACRIFTGAELPPGADAVVMQEQTSRDSEGAVTLQVSPAAGENIRPRGQDFLQGSTVVDSGVRLRPQEIGMIAAAGHSVVRVYRPLRVAVLTTGDELVEPGCDLDRGQIYNSNRYLIAAVLRRLGVNVTVLPPVRDTATDTLAALRAAARQGDVVISCGGVSVGEEDHVRAAVETVGQVDLWRVAIKPGKPFAFGQIAGKPFIGLPGNPASVLVTLLVLVRPWLLLSQGVDRRAVMPAPLTVTARFNRDKGERREYLRARLLQGELVIVGNQSSGVLSTASHADGFALQELGRAIQEGDPVDFLPWQSFW